MRPVPPTVSSSPVVIPKVWHVPGNRSGSLVRRLMVKGTLCFGLIPREEAFFDLFRNAAHNMIEAVAC